MGTEPVLWPLLLAAAALFVFLVGFVIGIKYAVRESLADAAEANLAARAYRRAHDVGGMSPNEIRVVIRGGEAEERSPIA